MLLLDLFTLTYIFYYKDTLRLDLRVKGLREKPPELEKGMVLFLRVPYNEKLLKDCLYGTVVAYATSVLLSRV